MFTRNSGLINSISILAFIKYLIFILNNAFHKWYSNNYVVTFKAQKVLGFFLFCFFNVSMFQFLNVCC